MRRFSILFLLFCLFSSNAFSATIDLIGFRDLDWGAGNSPGILSERDNWGEVAEIEYIANDSRIRGSNYSIYDPYSSDPGWGGVAWVYRSGYIETSFNTASTSLFVQFESDGNDGLANFYIDGTLEYSLNTNNGSWFAVVFSDLNYIAHTLKVTAAGTSYPSDIAIDAMGAGAPVGDSGSSPVPEPGTMILLGSGIAGLVGLRRKTKK